ncbi:MULTISPECIES: AAA family ATPase [Paenibacillus]|uniref:ATPase n=1 Tax=Paenibacillus albilobatus TaxID=2716884 RepID=A0A919XKD1_9BACL|nr:MULTISPECIES: AAA family ATPase [Paenibacillus]MDR9856138.1 AAA family ATPase [Paenibacillus sp. VCA1]GIO31848.1 ATPase [Paenibacillus albilobatus]
MQETIIQPEAWKETIARVRGQIGEVIVGQQEVVEQMLWCIFAGGHALLEGIPGLGKTMLVRTIADTLELSFSRIQFTPDLMPSDITGTQILSFGKQGETGMTFQRGPLFSSIVLADEINRATPKTQSALLEAMQEKTVTVGSETHRLPNPFFVLATQNPLENEGTYPLPEAQLDRFLLKILVPYPSADELKEIVKRTTSNQAPSIAKQAGPEELLEIQHGAREVLVADEVLDYAARLLMMSHPEEASAPEGVKKYVRFGSGPRGIQSIISTGKVRAVCQGRMHLAQSDINAVAVPALRHRIFLNFEGQALGVTTDQIIGEMLQALGGRP